ncbi:MAG: hypothetical protein NC543_04945 [bacterium]|nr:hypothetical protein [bacterium]
MSNPVHNIDKDTIEKMPDSSADFILFHIIIEVQKEIINNAEYVFYSGETQNILHNIKKVFKEIYADLSAIRLLDLELDDYLEAYIISESCAIEPENIPPETLNCFAMVRYICENHNDKIWSPDPARYGKKK